MAADNGLVNLEQLRLLANSNLLKDQLLVYFDLKTQREVQLATEINNLTRQLLDIIDERRLFIGEIEQRLPTNVMAYNTRQELKCHQKDDMIRAMEMRPTALQLHHQAMNGLFTRLVNSPCAKSISTLFYAGTTSNTPDPSILTSDITSSRSKWKMGVVELYFVRTDYQLVDIFTKALG
ncbi:hypothetical protein Tco_1336942 [Tanacetum coccineum]